MPTNNKTQLLYDLLKKCKVKSGEPHSHYSMGSGTYGTYNITSDDYKNLFSMYYAGALKEGTNLHILEKHKSNLGPIIIDVDLRYKSDDNSRKYKNKHIKKVIEVYNQVISKYLNASDSDYYAFVTEKKSPSISSADVYKDGFHIMYPNIWILHKYQFIIRKEVIKVFKEHDYFNDIGITTSYDQIFDEAVIKDNGWFLYGSGKEKSTPYKLTSIVNKDLKNYNTKVFLNDTESLIASLSIRGKGKNDLIGLAKGINESYIQEKCKEFGIRKKKKRRKKRRTSREYSEEDIERARKLVKMLSVERTEDFNDWINLGFCLHNIDDSLLDDWIDFSSQSTKFIPGDCERRWIKFRSDTTNGLSLGSLFRWAHEDNPDQYYKFKEEDEMTYIRQSISGTSGDVARAYYKINVGRYKCASIRQSAWYEFKRHRWFPVEEGYTIYKELNDVYPEKYRKVADYFYHRATQLDGDEKKLYEVKREEALKTAKKLTEDKFKKSVLSELKNRFKDEDFYSNLDENRNLMCFVNGVYDLENGVFRDGLPEDYISLCTNIDYVPYDPECKEVKEVIKFLHEVQPEEAMFNYVTDFFASCLAGHTRDELFHIWTGTGGNGKSIAVGMFQEALGDYATTISITLLTGKRAASAAASPEMVKTKGRRFLVFQEPENDDKIHVGHMKEMTGNDKISARALFKEPVEFYPQFKTILTCNRLPVIPSNDGGTWRRLRVVPWEMKFVDNPKEPNERKKDKSLKEKLPTWNKALMSILIERYRKYKEFGLVEPDKITLYSKEYQKRSDVYLEFITEYIELEGCTNQDRLKLTQLYNEFKAWWKENSSDRKVPGRLEFKEDFDDKFGRMHPRYGWKKMKMKEIKQKDQIEVFSDDETDKFGAL